MKKRTIVMTGLIVALTIGGVVSAFAFDKRQPGHKAFGGRGMFSAEALIERFSGELELTEEQKEQLLPLVEEKMSQMRGRFRKGFGATREGLWEEREKMWQDTEAQLAEILNEEQMQKLRDMKGSRMGNFAFARRGGFFRTIVSELQLSEEQRNDIFAIFDNYRDTRQKGMQNFLDIHAGMSDILLQEEFDEQKVRELFQQQAPQLEERVVEHAKMLSEVKAVLSPEQVEILQTKSASFLEKMQQWRTEAQ